MLRLAAAHSRLHSGAPWWLVRDGLRDQQAIVHSRCDVLVVGAGITGALVADALTAAGAKVMILDRRLPGSGSTSVSTALVQYELDTELTALTSMIGATDAVDAYQVSAAMLPKLATLSATLGGCGYAQRTSVYLAARRSHAARIQREAEARASAGLDVGYWSAAEVRDRFGVKSFGALYTELAAVIDPLALTRALLTRAIASGAGVSPWTTALGVEQRGASLHVTTDRGQFWADRVVLACGYEVPPGIEPSVMSLQSTYALVTEPIEQTLPLSARYTMWESARPYTYLRWVDNRLMIGGMDVTHVSDLLRDQFLPTKTRKLERELQRLVPTLHATTAYAWAGTFAETDDGLPVIGDVPGIEGVYYALGYGGNGITFSMLAAELLTARCFDRPDPRFRLYRADR